MLVRPLIRELARDGEEVADPVRAIVQGVVKSFEPHHGSNEHRCEAERQQPVSDGDATRKLLFRPVLVDVDPLIVAGRLRKEVDALLGDIDPLACADLAANRRLELTEVAEDAHVRSSCLHSSDQIFISGTRAGTNKSASVTAITSATLTPGAVS